MTSTTDRDAFVRCPTCHVTLFKLRPAGGADLTLDACEVCGGIWFDEGEVRQLRQFHPRVLASRIDLQGQLTRTECVDCGESFPRNAPACPTCERRNRMDCPGCGADLERIQRNDLTVDVCRMCKGVWFDNIELSQIWNLRLDAEKKAGDTSETSRWAVLDASDPVGFADLLLYSPDVIFVAASEGGRLAVEAITHAPEAAAFLVEGTGDLAGSVFEVVAEIIAGIFS